MRYVRDPVSVGMGVSAVDGWAGLRASPSFSGRVAEKKDRAILGSWRVGAPAWTRRCIFGRIGTRTLMGVDVQWIRWTKEEGDRMGTGEDVILVITGHIANYAPFNLRGSDVIVIVLAKIWL